MNIYIALLRGINVGGHNVIKMADLRKLFESMGFANVQTYIQSGNVLFQSPEGQDVLRERLEQAIEIQFGFPVPVMLRTSEELERIINHCPFSKDDLSDGDSLNVAMLADAPSPTKIDQLLRVANEMEECHVEGKDIYLLLRLSIRHSKLANQLQKLGVPVTVRNWQTMSKLLDMARKMNA